MRKPVQSTKPKSNLLAVFKGVVLKLVLADCDCNFTDARAGLVSLIITIFMIWRQMGRIVSLIVTIRCQTKIKWHAN